MLAIITFYILIVCTHRFWLPLVADFLVLENQPRHAELIVVATPFRPRFLHALDLLQKGYATQILLVGDARIKILWSGKTSIELAKEEAVKRGIPESKIHVKHSTGTRADALQAKLLMSSLGLKSALVVSDPYNMRRLAMVFDHVFSGTGLKLTLVPTDQKRKSPDIWWLSPHSFVYVIKEWIKLPMNYYLLNFRAVTKVQTLEEVKNEEIKKREIKKGALKNGAVEDPTEKFIEPKLEIDRIFSKEPSQTLFRLIKFKIGEFLVADEGGMKTDAVMTSVLSPQVALCYQKGLCKKIFLFSGISGYTRNNVKEDKILAEINIQAQEFGIDLKDITRVAHAISGATTTPQFLNNFMREKGLKSASLYLPVWHRQVGLTYEHLDCTMLQPI